MSQSFYLFKGKYTAYPSGELHVRDVDEHDSRRTYQCAVYHAQNQPKKSQQRFTGKYFLKIFF